MSPDDGLHCVGGIFFCRELIICVSIESKKDSIGAIAVCFCGAAGGIRNSWEDICDDEFTSLGISAGSEVANIK